MEHVTPSALRAHLKAILDRVNDDREPVIVVRGKGRSVVMLDAGDYDSLVETSYLTRSPANAERLREGMRQHQAGQYKEIDVTPYLD
ncbi:MAG: type II toxin-antitoxin system prevent-host-death family antitoxin [Candidatus Competibacter sp.]|nr:type II toxin-antitoxin system prevent-host-death family antitoxin [Candidatus Competibacter sp.]